MVNLSPAWVRRALHSQNSGHPLFCKASMSVRICHARTVTETAVVLTAVEKIKGGGDCKNTVKTISRRAQLRSAAYILLNIK